MAKTAEQHASEVRGMLDQTTERLREIIGQVGDARAKALFETSAEVLQGLSKAHKHFEEKSEEAWR